MAAQLRVLGDAKHRFGEARFVVGFEEGDERVVKVIAVDRRVGNDERNADGHELESLRAEGFVAECIAALGNDAKIGAGDDARNLLERNDAFQEDATLEMKLGNQRAKIFELLTRAINVEFGFRNLILDLRKGADREVETLMVIEGTGVQHDEFAVVALDAVSLLKER